MIEKSLVRDGVPVLEKLLLGGVVGRVLVLVKSQEIVVQTGHCLAALLLGRLVKALDDLANIFLVPQQRAIALRRFAQ